ncbi:MAG: hypothetical protein WDN49_09290 [Acetobacteraceae bacterium]
MVEYPTNTVALGQGDSRYTMVRSEIGAAPLQALIDVVPTGIMIAEAPSGRIIRGNIEMERILGQKVTPGLPLYQRWTVRHLDGRPVEPQEDPVSRAVARDRHVRQRAAAPATR